MEKAYVITCLNCNSTRRVVLKRNHLGEVIDWLESPENANAPICSARKRLDGNWGFQCHCGNNDLLTEQERRWQNPAAPTTKEIKNVIDNLKIQAPKFEFAEVA